MKQSRFELDLGYKLPLLQDLIADLQWPEANNLATTSECHKFVNQLQLILRVAMDTPGDVQDKQMAEANKSRCPTIPAITTGAKVCLDKKSSPITYANVNPTQLKLVHHDIGPYNIVRICRHGVKLDFPNDMTIYKTGNGCRLNVDLTDNSRVTGKPLPPPVRTSCAGTSYLVESIANHC